ncbi:hypothetical protein LPB140_04555 [Sphingorhabdus lutea]|uniref:Tryptophan 7-halogenase n=1 Tax=Sphingorhabdus lutea TaxID=1913578 RepID=A0A1L3JAP2_9SPHN|nr:tryptophan halogenase family protein [Sphingorhabdus lutea]APG62197.1 hypothetical protein LPB140_04555 [Sphingorhabdus lutea]
MKNIVIAGGGTAGWMAAAAFARFLSPNYNIILVESDDISTIGVGEATIPPIRTFNAGLGIDEREFIQKTKGSFKLGIIFDGWGRPDQKYIHAFGDMGRPLGLISYYQYWLRANLAGNISTLWDASPSAQAAYQNLYSHLALKNGGHSGVAWAYHFDAGLYAKFLREYSESRGVRRVEGKIVQVNNNGQNGNVDSLILENGDEISGDFFIDCTGFRALLIGENQGAKFDDWSHFLPCDGAVTVPCADNGPLKPYTISKAHKAGWQWRIALQHRVGNGHVFCSEYMSADEAQAILLAHLDGEPYEEPRHIKFTTGRRRQWVKNCLALGLSGGFMEPLESTSIYLIQTAIARFLSLLPSGPQCEILAQEFERQSQIEWQGIRDFLILHYYANQRKEPFWARCRALEIPQSLKDRINLFQQSGQIFRHDEELFTEAGWVQLMVGQGIMPRAYHPLANKLDDAQLAEFINISGAHARDIAGKMVDHREFINLLLDRKIEPKFTGHL